MSYCQDAYIDALERKVKSLEEELSKYKEIDSLKGCFCENYKPKIKDIRGIFLQDK